MFNIAKSDNRQLVDLGLRIYRNKLTNETVEVNGEKINKDEKQLIDIVEKTFKNGNVVTNNVELFNQFLVETSEIIAEPKITALLNLLADFSTAPSGTVKVYTVPETTTPKWSITAKGTGVDLQRLDGSQTKIIAVPQSLTYGGYYEITTFMADPIRAFNSAINNLVDAKLDFYFEKINELMISAIANSEIPDANCQDGSSLSLAEFQKVENTMIRLGGGRPVFYGDIALINHFSNLQLTGADALFITDELKNSLREDLAPSMISKTIALPINNTFIDKNNSKVKFSLNQGYMFPSSGKKPFAITEFGTQRQYSDINKETEQVEIKIVFEADVTLLNGRYLGSIKDDTIQL